MSRAKPAYRKKSHRRRVKAANRTHESIAAAARALGVVPSTIAIRIARGVKGYAYIDPPTFPKSVQGSIGRPRKLSPANEIRVRLERIAGKSRDDIADKFAVSSAYVDHHCRGLKGTPQSRIDSMIRKCVKLGAPVRNVAGSAGMSMAAVKRIAEGARA